MERRSDRVGRSAAAMSPEPAARCYACRCLACEAQWAAQLYGSGLSVALRRSRRLDKSSAAVAGSASAESARPAAVRPASNARREGAGRDDDVDGALSPRDACVGTAARRTHRVGLAVESVRDAVRGPTRANEAPCEVMVRDSVPGRPTRREVPSTCSAYRG